MTLTLHSHSPEQSLNIGKTLGSILKGDEIILLSGELGSGKTLLTKGIASSLGVNPAEVVSPTFTIMNQFEGYRENRSYTLFHFDCYRLGVLQKEKKLPGAENGNSLISGISESGITLPEVDEYLNEGVIVIEWAQYLHPSYFSLKKVIKTVIQIYEQNKRKIRIETDLDYLEKEIFSKYSAAK
jgi:tRNA threonylcarbamoyl adenosine modification protein YjeE